MIDIKVEIDRARQTCVELEQLVARREPLALDERGMLLVGYWNLMIDYHMSIVLLLQQGLCGGALALVRPMVEAWLRAHLVLSGNDEVLRQIKTDKYRTDFEDVADQIDEAFGLRFFGRTLDERVRKSLHSYTHSGGLQIARRFDGMTVKPSYSDDEKWEVVRLSTLALAMTTVLVTKKLGFESEWKAANDCCSNCTKESDRPCTEG